MEWNAHTLQVLELDYVRQEWAEWEAQATFRQTLAEETTPAAPPKPPARPAPRQPNRRR